ERLAGVGDVVGDQHPRGVEIDQLGDGWKDHGDVETLVHARVELDVHRPGVLDVERVPEGRADEEAAARDREDQVGLVPVVADLQRELAGRDPEVGPRETFALVAHAAAGSLRARTSTSTSARMSSRLRSGCQPIAARIFSVDGMRWSMSSIPWS